jgi:regulator of protease activity HflC (stomatin/prohibitin superfamily)
MDETPGIVWVLLVIVIIGVLCGGLYGCPKYNVYSQKLAGEAELARAESNRKIAIAEAEAKKESAKQLAEAEIIRAEGVAKANTIIGDSLKNNEAYLRYLYITGLNETSDKGNKIIYVPTEAGLPILEAGRFKK